MHKQIKFHEYKKESIIDQVYELMLHIGLPITVEILISELWLEHAGFSEWINLVVVLSSVLITLFFSVFAITPLIAYIKNIRITKLNKCLKTKQLVWLRNDFIKDPEFIKRMRVISKENFDWIIENKDKQSDAFYLSDVFELEQNFFTREVTGLINSHELAVGKMVSHSFEINREHKLLKLDLSYIQEINIEAKLENPKLKNFEGRLKLIVNYKTSELYLGYFVNDEIEEGEDIMYGVVFMTDKTNNK
ncbi:hypothetical protein [Spiroplasma endosymbiont of Othius punctulatus]|uniref:hypothetical protein n=1 Tax=Spiroplasma endosymbiont of Othius punctulatus TaxID=3066289 RepID=UPI0030CBB01B